jgi:hypothetical protein
MGGIRKRLHFGLLTASLLSLALAGAGTNLLDGKPVARGAALALGPWDLAIVEE